MKKVTKTRKAAKARTITASRAAKTAATRKKNASTSCCCTTDSGGDCASSEDVAALKKEILGLKALVEKSCGAPKSAAAAQAEEADALQRVLGDIVERRMDRVLADLVAIRNSAASIKGGEGRHTTDQLDSLLASLGAVRFDAERLEYLDPLIHVVSRETHDASLQEGVITEALRPGYATGRGVILAKALVAVNRRA